ncbi:MAG: DUF167 domain-containing protein [archaeon]
MEQYVKDGKLKIKVSPNSKKTEIKEVKDNVVFVNIAAPADKNKANKEVIRFFSKLLKKKVLIKSGLTAQNKTLFIH